MATAREADILAARIKEVVGKEANVSVPTRNAPVVILDLPIFVLEEDV